jgi:signal transduction histidine kinase
MSMPQVTHLRTALQRLASCRDSATLLTTLLSEARRLLGGELGLVWHTTDADQWRLQQTIGVTGAIPSRLQQLTLPQEGAPQAIARRLRSLGYRSVLLRPLRSRGRLIGLVALCSRRRRRFRRAHAEILLLLMHHAEVVMDSPGFRATPHGPEIDRLVDERSDPAERMEIFRLLNPLISGITHNLNNTLTVIGGRIELSLNQPQNQTTVQHLRASLRGVHQAGDVIRDLHDLLSVQRGGEHGSIDLNQVVHDCVQLARSTWFMERTLPRSPVQLVIDLHPVPPLMGSAADLKAALLILLQDMMRLMRPGHVLALRTWTGQENGRQALFLEFTEEPEGVRSGEPEASLAPACTGERSTWVESVPRLVADIIRRLGGRLAPPVPAEAWRTLTLVFTPSPVSAPPEA